MEWGALGLIEREVIKKSSAASFPEIRNTPCDHNMLRLVERQERHTGLCLGKVVK